MKNKNVWIYPLLILGTFFLLTISCKKEEKKFPPTLTTTELSNFTYNSATCKGIITSDGGATITDRGICWGLNPNPTIDDIKTTDSTGGTGSFTVNITGLRNNATFFARTYATNSEGTNYGQEISFTLWLNVADNAAIDVDNNSYSSVKIGNQVWLSENLVATHYRNGDPIQNLTMLHDEQWVTATTGAYCDYNDLSENAGLYGHLYNWYTVNDSRNVCPTGWHIPTKDDWQTLIDYLGGTDVAAFQLKDNGSNGNLWTESNFISNYASGFSALPAGIRTSNLNNPTKSNYLTLGSDGVFWAKEAYGDFNPHLAYYAHINSTGWAVVDYNANKIAGLSIRCIKD